MWSTGSSAHAPHIGTASASPIRHNRQISVPPIMPRIQQPCAGLSIGWPVRFSPHPSPPPRAGEGARAAEVEALNKPALACGGGKGGGCFAQEGFGGCPFAAILNSSR